MDIGTWHTIRSEKSLKDLFCEFQTAIEAKTDWSIESYQNVSEIRSRSGTIFAEGLGSETKTEILVLRYSYRDGTETSLSDPIPVVMSEVDDSTLLATVDFSPEGAIRVCPETIEGDVWSELSEFLEFVS